MAKSMSNRTFLELVYIETQAPTYGTACRIIGKRRVNRLLRLGLISETPFPDIQKPVKKE